MKFEIERKFLVAGDGWRDAAIGHQKLRDGLLARVEGGTVRVRVAPETAWITVKGPRAGLRRVEFEYTIPRSEGEEILLTLCTGPLVEKTRHFVRHGQLVWMVDVHEGDLTGLIFAEIELESEDQPLALPPWIGREITGEARYSKRALFARLAGQPTPSDKL